MKTLKKILILILITPILSGIPAMAYDGLSGTMTGARPIGMGGAFVALSDDVSSTFTNPAGLSQVDAIELTSMSGKLLELVDYKMIAAAIPFSEGTIGIGVITSNTPAGNASEIDFSGTEPVITVGEEILYTENQYVVSFGREVSENLLLGISGNIHEKGFTGAVENKASTYSINAGMILKPYGLVPIGINFSNVLAGKFKWESSHEEELLPSITVGTVINVIGKTGLVRGLPYKLDICADYRMETKSQTPTGLNWGMEFSPLNEISLRIGAESVSAANADGGADLQTNPTAGVGLKYSSFGFDYAYRGNTSEPEASTHYFSISCTL